MPRRKASSTQFVDGLLAALIAGEELGAKPAAGTGDFQSAEHAQLGGEIAEVEAVAVVQTGGGGVLVVAEVEMAVALGQQGLLD
jgi:hypothetical protein